MPHSYIYTGCFLKKETLFHAVETLRCNSLEREIDNPHVTFCFRPDEVDTSLFGTPVRIVINGYGNDGRNEGVRVSLSSDDARIRRMIDAIAVPHITLSVAADAKPVWTGRIAFSDVSPIKLVGYYGGYTKDGTVHTQPI